MSGVVGSSAPKVDAGAESLNGGAQMKGEVGESISTETTPHYPRKFLDESEDALALSFCEQNPNLRFVAGWGQWMIYTGQVWESDSTLAVYDMVRNHVRHRSSGAKQILKATSVAAIEKLAKSDRRYAATTDQWDANDSYLNTQGGVVDLESGEIYPHGPYLHQSKITPVGLSPDCPQWLKFLEEVTAGDEEYQAYLQRVCGYAATGSTKEHALFFLYGPGGNGKGTFLNTLQAVLGDYAVVASMETFTESKQDRHPADLAMLQGARVVFAQETESGKAWAESRIKSLTGGDPITARYMRQDYFTFKPKFKLLIAGNHKPRLHNVDDAMRRRLQLLPFTQKFEGENRCLNLDEKLVKEHGGILQWIIDGAVEYESQGLSPPKVVLGATAEYFEGEDLFQQWLADCCDLDPNYFDKPSVLFEAWRNYAKAANEAAGTQTQFRESLENAGFTSGNSRAKGGRFRQGLRVKQVQSTPEYFS